MNLSPFLRLLALTHNYIDKCYNETMKDKCAKCFKAVGTPARLKIFMSLQKNSGKIDVTNLVKLTKLRQPTVTFHINALVKVGLVKKVKEGRNVYLTLAPHCADCPLY